MILTAENLINRNNSPPIPQCPPQISPELKWGRTVASAKRGQLLTFSAMTLLEK